MIEPMRTPKTFTTARNTITTTPVRLAVFTPMSILPRTIGPIRIGGTCAICQSQWVVEIVGKKTPRNFPNATQTAAMVPV